MQTESVLPATIDRSSPSPEEMRARILAYYTAATPDYRAWSRDFNMHFGYCRRGMNPFRREAMLREMNIQVLARLALPRTGAARLADLGGGTGATARTATETYADLSVDVVTIAPIQVEIGKSLNQNAVRGGAITMHCADFAATPLPASAYDAVCLIECACHAPGNTKATVIQEAFRLLKPGGRLIVVDAMLKRALPTTGLVQRITAQIYRSWCAAWAVPEMCRLDLLPDAMVKAGFDAPHIEDWSWNIMPSVAHVPLFASYFTVKEVLKARGKLPPWRWRHILASFLTPFLGLSRSSFAYVAVVARKPLTPARAD